MSVTICIKNAVKKFGQATVIPDLSVEIHSGELFTLLGPSGCGKTTLLRMIAGFNSIEGGDFFFNEQRINDMAPEKRNIGMVFQNYAIFPHMSVEKNVAFGLKNHKFPKEEIDARVMEYLKLVQIAELRQRMPDRLSGGQQQRVALARALVINPSVLLMDEPLSNLDAKLRVEMRTVIKEIQQRVGITTVYVTHDQEEAMAISDRIAVLNQGVIQQIGTPKELYQRPGNLFVATFIGLTNILEGTVILEQDAPILKFSDHYHVSLTNLKVGSKSDTKVKVSVRPEEFVIETSHHEGLRGIVRDSVFLGLNTHYRVELETGQVVEIVQESTIDQIILPDTEIFLTVKAEKINVFTLSGAVNLLLEQDCEVSSS